MNRRCAAADRSPGTCPGRRGTGGRTGSPWAGGSGPVGDRRWRAGGSRWGRTAGGWSPSRPGCTACGCRGTACGWGPARRCVPAYMTTMSSARVATTPRSWVTRITAMCRSRWSSASRSRIWAWTVTSRPVVGSSAMTRRGAQARAMAIITRWRMPPDSWNGYHLIRCSGEGMPTERSSSMALALASERSMPEMESERLGDLARRSA